MFDAGLYSRETHEAWGRISQKRSCPPMDWLEEDHRGVREHLHWCAPCRHKQKLLQALGPRANGGECPTNSVAASKPGQICALNMKSRLLDEAAGEFANPPLVLILEERGGHARVAQLHDEPALAWECDVALDGENEGYFVESWNTYPLRKTFLGPALSSVSDETVAKVLGLGARGLPRTPPGSPYASFHALEAKIGSCFCAETLADLHERLAREEGPRTSVRGRATVIEFPGGAGGIERPGREYRFAMAAATLDKEFRDERTGASVRLRGSRAEIRGGKAKVGIRFRDEKGQYLSVRGRTDGVTVTVHAGEKKVVELVGPFESITPLFI